MGTNYYAKIIPSKQRVRELKNLLDKGDFRNIVEEVLKTYGHHSEYSEDLDEGIFHLGKSSGGYKFLWNCNSYIKYKYNYEQPTYEVSVPYLHHVYPLSKEGIRNFIFRKDVVVEDEYGREISKEDFLKLSLDSKGKCLKDVEDFDRYYSHTSKIGELLKAEGYDLDASKGYEFMSDGLRFSTSLEFL